jgi:aspartyl protease family protein
MVGTRGNRLSRALGLVIACAIVGALLLTPLDGDAGRDGQRVATDGNGAAQIVTVRRGDRGTFRVPVTLNGKMTVEALVDSGASPVVLCPARAKELRLPLGAPISVDTANRRVSGRRSRLASIDIGSISLRSVRAIVLPTQDCREIILGEAALSQLAAIVQCADILVLIGKSSPADKMCRCGEAAPRGP